ncbi:hypothetical protein Bbelb_318610 [Branchiostoma belcheri]|nr:hypothetical protein Bbelb_318610 [Branchiostoma belcheri]
MCVTVTSLDETILTKTTYRLESGLDLYVSPTTKAGLLEFSSGIHALETHIMQVLGSFAVASSLSSTSKDGGKEVAKAPSADLTAGGTSSVLSGPEKAPSVPSALSSIYTPTQSVQLKDIRLQRCPGKCTQVPESASLGVADHILPSSKDYNLIEGEVIPNEKWQYIWHSSLSQPDIHDPGRDNPDAIRDHFLEARRLMPRKTFLSLLTLAACVPLSSINRVTRAAKDAKHKRYKRFKQVKSFFLGHASVPGVGQTIRKMVMTKEEKQFAEEAEKAAAAFHVEGESRRLDLIETYFFTSKSFEGGLATIELHRLNLRQGAQLVVSSRLSSGIHIDIQLATQAQPLVNKLDDVVSLRPTYCLTNGIVDFYSRSADEGAQSALRKLKRICREPTIHTEPLGLERALQKVIEAASNTKARGYYEGVRGFFLKNTTSFGIGLEVLKSCHDKTRAPQSNKSREGHPAALRGGNRGAFYPSQRAPAPATTLVAGLPLLGYPDTCTDELHLGHAFCEEHCLAMERLNQKTKLREFLDSCGLPRKRHLTRRIDISSSSKVKKNPKVETVAQLLDLEFNARRQFVQSITSTEASDVPSLFHETPVYPQQTDITTPCATDDEDMARMTKEALELMLTNIIVVFERRFHTQLHGKYKEDNCVERREQMKNMLNTNMRGENDFGYFSYLQSSKPSISTMALEGPWC